MKYDEKVVLITGGSGGFGLTFGKSFLEKGAKVCFSDIQEGKELKEMEKIYGKDKFIFAKCDVTKDKDFQKTFKKCEEALGPVDILINNAGVFNDEHLELTLNVNLLGTIRGCENAMKKMGKHNGGKGGHVINIASISGVYPLNLAPFYAASKGGIVHYSRSIADDLHYEYSGVIVQCLCPASTKTPMACAMLEPNSTGHYNEFTQKVFRERIFLRNFIEPVDVTNALFKLLEEEKRGAVMVIEHNKEPYYIEFPTRT